MKLNKKLMLILSLSLVVSSTPSAFAKENVTNNNTVSINAAEVKYLSKDKAISIAQKAIKDYYNISIDEKEFTIETNQYIPDKNNVFYDSSFWNVIYTSKDKTKSICVSLDACNGNIFSLSIPYNAMENNKKPAITKLEAQKIAEDLFAQVAPDKSKQYKLTSSHDYNGITSFNFSRIVNGVEFDFDNAFIDVDTVNKKVVHFNYRYTENIIFAKKDSTFINKDAAKKIFNDNIKMNLLYIQDNKINNKYIPIYSSYFTQGYDVNANNGVFFNKYTEPTLYNINKDDLNKIIKKCDSKIEPKKLSISDDAVDLAVKLTKNIFDKDLPVVKVYNTNPSDQSTINNVNTWSIELKDDKDTNVYVSLNANNGSILNMYNSHESSTKDKYTPTVTWKEAYTKALETIAKYSPEKLSHINTAQVINEISKKDFNNEYMETDYYFNFTRNENGIDLSSECVYLSIDARTGNITSFGCNWIDNSSFVQPKSVISEEKAKQIFMDNSNVKLKYILEGSTSKVNLTYVLESNNPTCSLIDAISGKFIEPNVEGCYK